MRPLTSSPIAPLVTNLSLHDVLEVVGWLGLLLSIMVGVINAVLDAKERGDRNGR